ncbi:MAG: hypothetical protein L7F78_08490, partial [Syntrophales bacterium LBB04]|nr:hypothetical protein [Syntrophales bacterium LBB04]
MKTIIFIVGVIVLSSCYTLSWGGDTSTVYESDMFGNKDKFKKPKAIIETDRDTGKTKVYESDMFGNKDMFK